KDRRRRGLRPRLPLLHVVRDGHSQARRSVELGACQWPRSADRVAVGLAVRVEVRLKEIGDEPARRSARAVLIPLARTLAVNALIPSGALYAGRTLRGVSRAEVGEPADTPIRAVCIGAALALTIHTRGSPRTLAAGRARGDVDST